MGRSARPRIDYSEQQEGCRTDGPAEAGSVLGRGTIWGHRDSLWFIIYGFSPSEIDGLSSTKSVPVTAAQARDTCLRGPVRGTPALQEPYPTSSSLHPAPPFSSSSVFLPHPLFSSLPSSHLPVNPATLPLSLICVLSSYLSISLLFLPVSPSPLAPHLPITLSTSCSPGIHLHSSVIIPPTCLTRLSPVCLLLSCQRCERGKWGCCLRTEHALPCVAPEHAGKGPSPSL